MKLVFFLLFFVLFTMTLCSGGNAQEKAEKIGVKSGKTRTATFAGGCFWCMEQPFEQVDGVIDVVSGYTGGHTQNPRYEEVCSGITGHAEAIQVQYDADRVSYQQLLDMFWQQIDPTDGGGQFADRGSQYRTAIFYHNEEQRQQAEESKKRLDASERFSSPIKTAIEKFTVFYPAEEYHQDYYRKCPVRYSTYKKGSGRESFIKDNWKTSSLNTPDEFNKPDDQAMKTTLSPLQYRVTQQCGTEPPFQNEYWDNKRDGIYVDIVSGEVLFSSKDKFDSGSGWPSFTQPLIEDNIIEHADSSYRMVRREVRSKQGDSHLGHVFDDGPGENGLRYCINSAALRFIPKENLEKEGYGEYVHLFESD